MNDSNPLSDEALSAYLDGEATPAEVARIEADPSLLSELASMRSAATAVATFEPPSDDRFYELRQMAINGPSALSAPVADLDFERSRRRARLTKFGAAIAVAAAVVVAALVVPNLKSDDLDTAATDFAPAGDDETAPADAAVTEDATDYSTADDTGFDVDDAQSFGDDSASDGAAQAEMASDEAGAPSTTQSDAAQAQLPATGPDAYLLPDLLETLDGPTAAKLAEQLSLLGQPILLYRAADLAEGAEGNTLADYVCSDNVMAARADGAFLGGGSLVNDDSATVEYIIQRNADGVIQLVSYLAPECVAAIALIEP